MAGASRKKFDVFKPQTITPITRFLILPIAKAQRLAEPDPIAAQTHFFMAAVSLISTT